MAIDPAEPVTGWHWIDPDQSSNVTKLLIVIYKWETTTINGKRFASLLYQNN